MYHWKNIEKMQRWKFLKCVWMIGLILSCHFSKAITITWNGSTSQSWEINTNWTPAQVPSVADDVIIDSDSVIIMKGYLAEAKSVLVTGSNVYLTIEDQAQLKISGSTTNGMIIQSSAKVLNYGSLSTNQTGGTGLNNLASSFENYGDINLVNAGGKGLNSSNSFVNHNGANIQINNCESGLSASDSFINNGLIHIEDVSGVGLIGSDDFINNHIIEIDDVDCFLCDGLLASDQFLNNSGATISINNVDVSIGIFFRDNATNIGTISIDSVHSFSAMYIGSGNTSNQGTLNISNVFLPGGVGLEVNGNFSNSGNIIITSEKKDGITIDDHFINELSGQIMINSGPVDWIANGIVVSDTLTNFGLIQISESTNTGIYNKNAAIGLTVNGGSIEISATGTAVWMASGSLSNGGGILIDQCTRGLYLSLATWINSSQGNMNISDVNDGIDVTNSSSMEIQFGSEILVSSTLGIPLQIDQGCTLIGDGLMEFK